MGRGNARRHRFVMAYDPTLRYSSFMDIGSPDAAAEDAANAEWERLLLEAAVEEGLESSRREGTIPHEVVEAEMDRMLTDLRARRDNALREAAERRLKRTA